MKSINIHISFIEHNSKHNTEFVFTLKVARVQLCNMYNIMYKNIYHVIIIHYVFTVCWFIIFLIIHSEMRQFVTM